MTNDTTLWTMLRKHLPRREWISTVEIFRILRPRIPLDAEDMQRMGVRSRTLRWEFNVRRVLHSKQREGTLSARESGQD